MNHLKAIETHYNGYRFRSRLEARWAVFFDSYGVEYEYELEGFDLGKGQKYLPDFYIPNLNSYVEIKPNRSFTLAELKKIDTFALGFNNNLLLVMGTPTKEEMVLINRCNTASLYEYIDENEFGLSEEEIVAEYLGNAIDFSLVEFNRNPFDNSLTLAYVNRCPPDEIAFKESLLKAKKARFEHGESG